MDQDDEGDEENKMVKPIVKDVFFLGQKSEPATKADLQVGRSFSHGIIYSRTPDVLVGNFIGLVSRSIRNPD